MLKHLNISTWTFLLLSLAIVLFRSAHIDNKEISWDVFGYYLPLQATFIENDPMLDDRSWVDETVRTYQISGTSYFVSSNDDGEPMYFFLFGMSYLYSLFFFLGHLFAGWMSYAQDGLSPPYQFALVYGCLIYTVVGLYYLKKILGHFFNNITTSITLILIVVGTNYAHHMTLKNLETVNVLFMLAGITIWNTIKWYEKQQLKRLIYIGVSLTLMALAKPSEILFILVPILWGITSIGSGIDRVKLWFKYKWHFLIAISVCLIIAAPQIMYWYSKTGNFFYDTYKNPGVGLDIFAPHIWESLFSYRKGWLLYTPMMLFALVGFYFLFKFDRKHFLGILIPFLVSFFIIASWTEYWYGAGFSNRPVITLYTLLAIPLGYFVLYILNTGKTIRLIAFVGLTLLIFLNQFQWWQFRNFILHPYRTTKDYYWAVFLKTSVSEDDKNLLLINRDFSGIQTMSKPERYHRKLLFQDYSPKIEITDDQEYYYEHKARFKDLTSKDHCWIQFSFDYQLADSSSDVMIATMMECENGSYAPHYYQITPSSKWSSFDTLWLTPEIRDINDQLKYFIWDRSKSELEIMNFQIHIYERN